MAECILGRVCKMLLCNLLIWVQAANILINARNPQVDKSSHGQREIVSLKALIRLGKPSLFCDVRKDRFVARVLDSFVEWQAAALACYFSSEPVQEPHVARDRLVVYFSENYVLVKQATCRAWVWSCADPGAAFVDTQRSSTDRDTLDRPIRYKWHPIHL